MDVLVEHDYIARDSKELTITKGDVIRNAIKKEDGWWEGILNNKKGVFPDKYVTIMEKDNTNVVLRNRNDSSRIRQCRVVFSYKQDHEDELTLKIGDIIDILGEVEEGWWRGILNGREGVFPSNFVQEIPANVPSKIKASSKDNLTEINNIPSEITTPSIYPKIGKTLCKVKFSYKAQNEDELSLKEGDIVTLISKDGQDVGWWKGELNGVIGLFPDNFVTVINNQSDSNDKRAKTPEHDSTHKTSKTTSVRKSLENDKPENETHSTAKTPPLPGKKPILPIKKSPSNSGSTGGLFLGLKKKIIDVVDGTTGSKNSTPPKTEINCENNNEFDDVVRRPLLSDVRASRPKAPGRRLPTTICKDSESMEGLNGNDDHNAIPDPVTPEPTPESPSELDGAEVKPKLREWEKHKAPWLEEMKLNQLKRSSSPADAIIKLKTTEKTNSGELEAETKMSKSVEKEPSPIEMSRSLIVEPKVNVTPIRSNKSPGAISSRPQTIHCDVAVQPKIAPIKPSPVNKSPTVPPKINDKREVDESDGPLTKQQYTELVEKISRLEEMIDKQHLFFTTAIDELKSKLELETEMRMKLQVKIENLLTEEAISEK